MGATILTIILILAILGMDYIFGHGVTQLSPYQFTTLWILAKILLETDK